MNGYKMMADSYKKMMSEGRIDPEIAQKEIRIYDFLGSCDQDDLCRMVDSSAFNEIIKSYVRLATQNAGVTDEEQKKILNQLGWIFDEKQAKEVMKS